MQIADDVAMLRGAIAVDDRGEVSFVNDFDFKNVRRFYTVRNHRAGFVRAWHAHRKEAKYVTVIQGAALVGAVRIDDWETPSVSNRVERHALSADTPAIIYIPAGFANGFMSLTADAKLMFFSTSSVEESRGDDIRFPAHYWDIWSVEER